MIANAFAYIEENTCLRFAPDRDNMNPRMDIISDNLGGLYYTSWQTYQGTYAEVNLTPSSACTVPRTIVHELMADARRVLLTHTQKGGQGLVRQNRDGQHLWSCL